MYNALDISLPEMFATLIVWLHELFAASFAERDEINNFAECARFELQLWGPGVL